MMSDDETLADLMLDHPELFPGMFGPYGNFLAETECVAIDLPSKLIVYKPEEKRSSVSSFLVLFELCENFQVFTKVVEGYSEVFLFDSKEFSDFRVKLRKIQKECVKMAKKSLGVLFPPSLPSLALDLIFEHIFRVSAEDNRKPLEDIVKFEEHNEAAKRILKRTYAKLTSLYVDLRNFKHAAWCDRHTDEDHAPREKREEFSCKLKKFKLEKYWWR